jgi:predicted enzyme related to lactoylglutathione lyase
MESAQPGQGGANFVTPDFDAVHQRAPESGATFYIDLGEIPSGARTFGIKDPDGNLITFVEA